MNSDFSNLCTMNNNKVVAILSIKPAGGAGALQSKPAEQKAWRLSVQSSFA